ncbi:hypothetical protein AMJ39_01445 [candidate division TA06 bacterium DG_24]|uniref:Uncharacterized protein n=2 Tax=Bacteria division TA06 TaxID=1156500 RepID=A0A0S8JNY9_UNCT6|nr:MAG: hypothetical protein AMJ39_01445 [candidate division TA06 bacterium DG_24]KPL11465.1 MAG: hypothetical protein AMJ71_00680 [candidate division TA06 bacterium SM1_40]
MANALCVLLPSESKRLIAMAVAGMPEVRQALERGWIVIGRGTTNAYVAEELLNQPLEKERHVAGYIGHGELAVLGKEERQRPIVLKDGSRVEMSPPEALQEFSSDDVFIKGANAVDPEGNVGILMGSPTGGTVAQAMGIVLARGAHFIVPVGLEKLIPSVINASLVGGQQEFDCVDGRPCALMPVVNANVVTEIEALGILADVDAVHFASGGVFGSEGAVVLAITGERSLMAQAVEIIGSVKGEPPLRGPSQER